MQGPSKYGGIAAVAVFGVGLLLVGETWTGIGVLSLVVLVMAVSLATSNAAKVFLLAIGALVCSGVLAYNAASSEITGKATYSPGTKGPSVTVMRQDSPAKFREATNFHWGLSILFLLVSVVVFDFHRGFDDYP